MKIAWYLMQCDYRAIGRTIYDYAHYNENILNNESIIITTKQRPLESWDRFCRRFETCILVEEDWSPIDNSAIKNRFERIVSEHNIDIFYIQHGGNNYRMIPDNCKTAVHCVFDMSEPHGTNYAGISEYIARKHNRDKYVPYMVNLPNPNIDLRERWGIPSDAIVFGRHGGHDSFHNLGGSYRAIIDILNNSRDKYFVFLNTDKFAKHERIIYLPPSNDPQYISNFINSCDAMLHCRNGETFGLAVGEFSWFNKPVITYGGRQDDYAHLEILGDNCYKYYDYDSLINILGFFDKDAASKKIWNNYQKFAPSEVMVQFKEIFII